MTVELGPRPASSRDMPFWDWLVAVGLIEGDPAYYSSGQAAQHAGAYGHAITVALQASAPGSPERAELVDRMYEEGIITSADTPEGRAYWTDTASDAFGADIENLANAAAVAFGETGAATVGSPSGIMGGGQLTRIVRQGQAPIWAMTYNVNGMTHVYTFDSPEQVSAALGEGWETRGYIDIAEDTIDTRNGTILTMGSATPLIGQDGDYGLWLEDVQRAAAVRAGVRDPGKLGEYLADPEIQRILAMGAVGGWTEQQVQAEIRNTNYYQNVLYPGISKILATGQGGTAAGQPEAAWWSYYNSVEESLASLGYERDADGSYRSQIGTMLNAGISDTVFNQMAPAYLRASQDAEFAGALDYWLDKTAGRNVTFDDVFDALTGQTSGDLALAVEQGIIQYQANRTSTTLSDEQISRIAKMTDLHEREIAQAFTTAEEQLLGLGDIGLARYGLSEQALVSAAFGLEEGDQTAAEIRRTARKTLAELGAQDDQKAQFYTTFDQRKRPVREGLAAGAPEYG